MSGSPILFAITTEKKIQMSKVFDVDVSIRIMRVFSLQVVRREGVVDQKVVDAS